MLNGNSLSRGEMSEELDLSTLFLQEMGVDVDNWIAYYPYDSFDEQSIQLLNERGAQVSCYC